MIIDSAHKSTSEVSSAIHFGNGVKMVDATTVYRMLVNDLILYQLFICLLHHLYRDVFISFNFILL